MATKEINSLESTISTIQKNMRRTLNPECWNLEGLSDAEIENNIKRNMFMVQALTFFDSLEFNGAKLEGRHC